MASAFSARRSAASAPSALFRSSVTERRPRSITSWRRSRSSPSFESLARSTSSTSAPMSASIMAANGPGPIASNSRTRKPARGPIWPSMISTRRWPGRAHGGLRAVAGRTPMRGHRRAGEAQNGVAANAVSCAAGRRCGGLLRAGGAFAPAVERIGDLHHVELMDAARDVDVAAQRIDAEIGLLDDARLHAAERRARCGDARAGQGQGKGGAEAGNRKAVNQCMHESNSS